MEMKDMIKKLKNLLDELAAEEDPEEGTTDTPPHPRWKPENKEMYYTISGDNTPQAGLCDSDDETDIRRYSIGNVFRTKAEAEFDAERLKVLAEMREWAGKWCDTWCIYYTDGRIEPFSVRRFNDITYGEMRFASEADARNCIKAVGEDRIKKYYFMIPEDEDDG